MKNVLITGGSGTLGNALTERLYGECDITIYSRSEFLQAQMRRRFPKARYVLGDVTDYSRLQAATAGHDTIIHAAAMKRLPECEAQPEACYQTNVAGSANVAYAAQIHSVETVIGISTDKACQSVTVYGATKLMMERIFANQPDGQTRFVCVRYGNVLQSRGSVIPLWRSQVERGQPVTLTDARMTRFWMTPTQAVDVVMEAMSLNHGETLVPKMAALPVVKMASYILGDDVPMTEIGLRGAERLHEWLVSPDETVIDTGNVFIVSPRGEFGLSYRSDDCRELTQAEFLTMLAEVES